MNVKLPQLETTPDLLQLKLMELAQTDVETIAALNVVGVCYS